MSKKVEIKSIDEITEQDTKYFFVDESGNRTGKWIEIEQNARLGNKFCINYYAHFYQFYNFVTKGNYVRTWKTFNGALRYARKNMSFD